MIFLRVLAAAVHQRSELHQWMDAQPRSGKRDPDRA